MTIEDDDAGNCIRAEELLPPIGGSEEALPPEVLSHVSGCERCAARLRRSTELAAAIRALPRLTAPSDSILSFETIYAQAGGRLDEQLVAQESKLRPQLQSLERMVAPASLLERVLPSVRRARVRVLERIVALAAAAGLVLATFVTTLHGPFARTGPLASRTERVTGEPISVDVEFRPAGTRDPALSGLLERDLGVQVPTLLRQRTPEGGP